jgi:hypothetical protein
LSDSPTFNLRYFSLILFPNVKAEAGEALPCTPEERWEGPTRFAVMKQGQKRAVRVFDTREEAEGNVTKEGLYVEERTGSSIRCESYCRVSSFCPQYARMRTEKAASDNELLNTTHA